MRVTPLNLHGAAPRLASESLQGCTLAYHPRWGNLIRARNNETSGDNADYDYANADQQDTLPGGSFIVSGVVRNREQTFANTAVGTSSTGYVRTILLHVYRLSALATTRYIAAQGGDADYDWRFILHNTTDDIRYQWRRSDGTVQTTLQMTGSPVGLTALCVRQVHNGQSTGNTDYARQAPSSSQGCWCEMIARRADGTMFENGSTSGSGSTMQTSHSAISLCNSAAGTSGLSYNLDDQGIVAAYAWNRWISNREMRVGLSHPYALLQTPPSWGRRTSAQIAAAGGLSIPVAMHQYRRRRIA